MGWIDVLHPDTIPQVNPQVNPQVAPQPAPKSGSKSSRTKRQQERTLAKAVVASAILGCLVGALCFVILRAHNQVSPETGAADFQWSLRAARDLISGRDVYAYEPSHKAIPYPLPAALAAVPLAWLPDVVAGSVFFGLSTALLAFCCLRFDQEYRLAMLVSWPFLYAMLWVQWSPLLCVLWFFPAAAATLLLIKPNIALPVFAASRKLQIGKLEFKSPGQKSIPREAWIVAGVGLLSLIVYPTWPIVWLKQTSTYEGIRPPLLVMPLGPFILMTLFAWRDRRAWLILFCALMPQRVVYDQLPLLLVARNKAEIWLLIACSWVNGVIFWNSENGWLSVPLGSQNFFILTLYLPAIAVVLGSLRESRAATPAAAAATKV